MPNYDGHIVATELSRAQLWWYLLMHCTVQAGCVISQVMCQLAGELKFLGRNGVNLSVNRKHCKSSIALSWQVGNLSVVSVEAVDLSQNTIGILRQLHFKILGLPALLELFWTFSSVSPEFHSDNLYFINGHRHQKHLENLQHLFTQKIENPKIPIFQ